MQAKHTRLLAVGTLGVSVIVAACAIEDDGVVEDQRELLITGSEEAEIALAEDDAGPLDSFPDSEGSEPDAGPPGSFPDDKPCGDRPSMAYDTVTGTEITVCFGGGGDFTLLENGAFGQHSAIQDGIIFRNLQDVFLQTAVPDAPLPDLAMRSDLIRPFTPAEAMQLGELGASDPIADVDLSDRPDVLKATYYCGSSGASRFIANHCYDCDARRPNTHSVGDYDCSYVCASSLYTWHQRTCSAMLGHNGDYAFDRVAACNGDSDDGTTHRSWRENAGVGGLDLEASVDVQPGYWHLLWMSNGGAIDDNFRFRGDQIGPTTHRYSTEYSDNEWP